MSPAGRVREVHALPDSFILQSVSSDGERCLLVSSADRTSLTVRRAGAPARDLSWLRWTFVADLSPDGRSVLFFDTGASPKIAGLWLRSLDGGDAGRISDGDRGRFSPDGSTIVSTVGDPPQLTLIPLGGGNHRQLTSAPASHSAPVYAGPTTLLYVRAENGARGIWRIESDGTGARSLGADGCDLPAADTVGQRFLCLAGERNGTLFVYPMAGGPGRKLFELSRNGRFRYARWSTSGNAIYAVTGDREFLTLDATTGVVKSRETLPVPGSESYDTLFSAAFNGDASVQAYSVARFSAGMAKHVRLQKEADVLFLLKRRPALQKVLKQLDLKLSPTGQLLGIPFDGCPFDGCPLPLDLREYIVNPAAVRTRTAARTKTAARKRNKPA